MDPVRIAICSLADDLHALLIRKTLQDRHNIDCSIIESDRISNSSGLSWSNLRAYRPTLPTGAGDSVDVTTLDAIWWRRSSNPQQLPIGVIDPAHLDVITNDCRDSLLGILLNDFSGAWISDPQATRRAENKLVQLRAAQCAGFKVPRTLISQDPVKIREFCHSLDYKVVVKPVKGTVRAPLLTTRVSKNMLNDDECLRLSPAIYQERIGGTHHIRVSCFGRAIHAASIESEHLDWRPYLNVPVKPTDLPGIVEVRLRRVLRLLRLRMGVFDLKFDEFNEPVWLEVNPQGQFLFVEALSGLQLVSAFCKFLYEEAKRANGRRRLHRR